MKRYLLLSVFLLSLISVYGQDARIKKVERIPVDSTVVRPSAKGSSDVIDGSKNGQTKSSAQSNNPFITPGGRQLQIPERIKKDTVKTVEMRPTAPQTVFIERERSQVKASMTGSHEETTFSFFRETPHLNIPLPEKQVRIHHIETDHLGFTLVRGTQMYRSIPVYGMDFTLNISAQSERFMGCTVDTTQIDTGAAKLSADDAVRIAQQDLGATTEIKAPGELMRSVMGYSQPSFEAIYYPVRLKTYRYCYRVIIRPNIRDEWIYYIDAQNGKIVEKYNNTPTDGPNKGTGSDLNGVSRTVDTYLENNTHYMVNATKTMFNKNDFSGIIAVYDVKNDKGVYTGKSFNFATSSSANWNNPQAISTMYHTSLVYDYLQNTFNRKSFDGKGSSMMAFINFPDEYGNGYDNAFWNGQIIALGNGNTDFHPLPGALDVIAHEFGHAVVSNTAKLEYKNQSGAVNETYADIFGAMVDRANWTIGEKVIKDRTAFPSGALRDMSNPHNGGKNINDDCWQPAHVSEMYLGSGDNGGVHINSGIPNYAYYTYATATSKERAEQVFYRALTNYLTPTSKFLDLRKAVIQSAKDLNFSNDVQTIGNAFDKVGIVDDTIDNNPPNDLPKNPGQWGLLLCNTDPNDRNSLYKTTDYKTLTPVSTTGMYSTPSVTDDGKSVIFADIHKNIRLLDMTTGKETVINAEGDNQSVAISRDGKRIAVISTYEDGRIYLLDRQTGEWITSFRLYNPTTGTGGAKSGGPRYADAIEFDHTGQYLIYDAYNVVGSSIGGKEVDHWDIGLIHVWDNQKNSFGTGEVVKLFSDLTPGVNIMNPVFSKNSPHIIAFDYYDNENGFITFGVNLSSGDIDGFTNNFHSYPSFSMDDKHLAFTMAEYNGSGDIEELYVGYIGLGSDKISVNFGTEQLIASGAAFPVYYGTGTRQMGTKPVASFTADARSGGRPLNIQFVDMTEGNPTSWSWTFQGGTPAASTQQHPKVSYNTAGTYPVKLMATNSYGSDEIVKQGYVIVAGGTETTGTETAETVTIIGYPNPATNDVWVYGAGEKAIAVKLFDVAGKSIPVTFNNELDKIRINVSALSPGIYILQIALSDGNAVTQKIVKQ